MTHPESQTLISTQRLHIRRLLPEDVDDLLAVYGDLEAMRWVGDGQPLDRAACEQWVAVTDRNVANRGYGMSAMVDRDTHAVVGFVGLVHPGGQELPELKYALKRTHWGVGLATEAARAVLAWGAERFGLSTIIATIAPENEASRRILVKLGMTEIEPRLDEDGLPTCVFRWVTPG